jgi:hypothetical protein
MGTTPILGLSLPVLFGDFDTWGTKVLNDYSILDSLGAGGVFNVSSAFLMSAGTQVERFYRVTTGGLTVPGTLPDPGTIPTGKLFHIKMLDIGGVSLACVNPAVPIDGQPNYLLGNQYNFVRLLANGATYDVAAYG